MGRIALHKPSQEGLRERVWHWLRPSAEGLSLACLMRRPVIVTGFVLHPLLIFFYTGAKSAFISLQAPESISEKELKLVLSLNTGMHKDIANDICKYKGFLFFL